MLWVLYTLISAFSWATADAFTKKISYKFDDYIVIFSRFLYATPFLLVLLFFIEIPSLNNIFWITLIISLPIEVIAWILYIKAIRVSPLSLVVPFITLTPVFLILTSFLILGEFPTLTGLIGIFFVVFGAYLLNIQDIKKGLLAPIKAIFKERGCIFMIIVAFLFSINTNLGKVLARESSPMFVSATYFPLVAIILFTILMIKSKNNINQLYQDKKMQIFSGFFFALMMIFHYLAVMLVIVPYMSSVKRTSTLFGTLYGWLIFKERNISGRIIGTIIMLVGVSLITIF